MLVALVMVDYLATNVAQENYIQNLTAQLADKARTISLIPPGPEAFDPATARALSHAAGGRLTVVRADGKVMVDSEADPATMENHRNPNRPELMEAFAGRVGTDQRLSQAPNGPSSQPKALSAFPSIFFDFQRMLWPPIR